MPSKFVHAEGVQLGSCIEIVVAWWGQHPHPLCHGSSSTNAIVCHPDDEDTMVCSQATGWMQYIIHNVNMGVAGVYSVTGVCVCLIIIIICILCRAVK